MIPLPIPIRLFSTRSKYNKAKASGHFNAVIPEGRPGVTTMISEEMALDIAFVSVLTRRGFPPEDAKLTSHLWLERLRDGRGLRPLQIFLNGGSTLPTDERTLQTAIEHPSDQVDMPDGAEIRRSTDLVVINVEEIQARLRAWAADYDKEAEG